MGNAADKLDVCELQRLDEVSGGVLEELGLVESKGSALLTLQEQGAAGRL